MPEQTERPTGPAEAYDKLLIALAGGALTLTIGFVKDVVNLRQAHEFYWLYISWGCFASALVITMIGYVIALEHLAIEAGELPNKAQPTSITPLRRLLRTATVSMYFFACGVMFFLWFVVINIPSAAVGAASVDATPTAIGK